MPLGTAMHNIEITRGRGGQLAKAAGAVAKLIAKEGKLATCILCVNNYLKMIASYKYNMIKKALLYLTSFALISDCQCKIFLHIVAWV
jgi:hypothetical protein